jgi:pimeloyl-ACP methyl ester carboxylesterase
MVGNGGGLDAGFMKLANGLRAHESAACWPDSAILRRRATPVIGESAEGAAEVRRSSVLRKAPGWRKIMHRPRAKVEDSRMTSRTPLVLLPGLLLDRRLYGPQLGALADVAAIDVPDLTQDESMAAMAERVLAAAPERFALCGLSMGGYLAFEIMRQAPERIERLALLDTQARPDTDEARERRLSMMAQAREGDFAGVLQRLLPLLIHPGRLADQALVGLIASMAEGVGREAFLRQQNAILNRKDSRPSLGAIACPALVLCGREDALTPAPLHHEMATEIPNATLAVLPNCGHLSPLEAPEAVSALLRLWLAGTL